MTMTSPVSTLERYLWPFPWPRPKPKPAHVMAHECHVKFLMGVQVSAIVDEDVVSRLDSEADQRGLSRSKLIAHVLSEYVIHETHVDSNVEKLTVMVQEKDTLIAELKDRITWLEGHISILMTERDRLLPAPRVSFWTRVFRGSG